MYRFFLVLIFFTNHLVFIQAQDLIYISNPSFEAKKETEVKLPMGWQNSLNEDALPCTLNWSDDEKKASHGISYITFSNTDSSYQVIRYNLINTPMPSYRTYRVEMDVSLHDIKYKNTKLQIIGYGENYDDYEVLASSWPIDHVEWKKINLDLNTTKAINWIEISITNDDGEAMVAIDNISQLNRVRGKFYCQQIITNGYDRIARDYYISEIDGSRFIINEVKYHCVYSSFYTQKVLFDNYGFWDDIIYYDDHSNERLLWRNIKLFEDSDETYSIAASGEEDHFEIYASIIVFDSKGADALHPDHLQSDKISNLIGNLIKENNAKKKEFYKVFEEEIGN